MVKNKTYSLWLRKAEDDFRYVLDSYQEKNKHYAQVLFFAHLLLIFKVKRDCLVTAIIHYRIKWSLFF